MAVHIKSSDSSSPRTREMAGSENNHMPGSTPSKEPGNIEEGTHVYRPGGFHPIYIGDVFKERYKTLNKIGYGVYSTVWLVRDLLTR